MPGLPHGGHAPPTVRSGIEPREPVVRSGPRVPRPADSPCKEALGRTGDLAAAGVGPRRAGVVCVTVCVCVWGEHAGGEGACSVSRGQTRCVVCLVWGGGGGVGVGGGMRDNLVCPEGASNLWSDAPPP